MLNLCKGGPSLQQMTARAFSNQKLLLHICTTKSTKLVRLHQITH